MMPPPARYFLCDQSLRSLSGHCYAYFEPLAQVVRERGHEAVIVGNRVLAEPVAARGVVPGFSYLCDEQNFAPAANLPTEAKADAVRDAHERAIFTDLQQLQRRYRFVAGDRLIINSIRHWAIRGLVRWLEAQPDGHCPQVALLLHFTSEPERFRHDPAMRHYRDAFAEIETSPCARHIHLYADATTLIDEYREMTSLEIILAPFPHGCSRPAAPPERAADHPLRVGYIGEARYHKGFQLLPFVAAHLARSALGDRVQFHIHSFIFDRDAWFYRQVMPHLRRASNVTLYPDIFGPQEYEDFVGSCDAVLIPYLLTYYHRQTSGIFADAIGMGVPVVVSRGTWMAKQLKQLGGGLIANPEDFLSFAEATYQLCADIGKYRDEASRARTRWRAFNRPENLVDMFECW